MATSENRMKNSAAPDTDSKVAKKDTKVTHDDDGDDDDRLDDYPLWLRNSLAVDASMSQIRNGASFSIRQRISTETSASVLSLKKKLQFKEAIASCELIMGLFHWLEKPSADDASTSDSNGDKNIKVYEFEYEAQTDSEAIKINKIRKWCLSNIINCLQKIEKWDDCTLVCDALVNENPDYAAGYYERYRSRSRLGTVVSKVALNDLKHALKFEPNNKHYLIVYKDYHSKCSSSAKKRSSKELELMTITSMQLPANIQQFKKEISAVVKSSRGNGTNNNYNRRRTTAGQYGEITIENANIKGKTRNLFLEFKQYMQSSVSDISQHPALVPIESQAAKHKFVNEIVKNCLITYANTGDAEKCLENLKLQDPATARRDLIRSLKEQLLDKRKIMATELAVTLVEHFKPQKYREMLLIRRGGPYKKPAVFDVDNITADSAPCDAILDMDEDIIIEKINELNGIKDEEIKDMLIHSVFVDVIEDDRLYSRTGGKIASSQQAPSNAKQLENSDENISKEIMQDLKNDSMKDDIFLSNVFLIMTGKYGVRMTGLGGSSSSAYDFNDEDERLSSSSSSFNIDADEGKQNSNSHDVKHNESSSISKDDDAADDDNNYVKSDENDQVLDTDEKVENKAASLEGRKNVKSRNKASVSKSSIPMLASIIFGLLLLLFHLFIFLGDPSLSSPSSEVVDPANPTPSVKFPKRNNYDSSQDF